MIIPRRLWTSAAAALIGLATLLGAAAPTAAYTPAEGKAPMTVMLVRSDAKDCGTDCPEWIALTGKILPQTPALLTAVLARTTGKHLPVLVDSPGGAVEAALSMGRMIRARKLDVAVAGTALSDCAPGDRACLLRVRGGERPGYVAAGIAACASACVFVLAAGTDRLVGRESYVGVHQMTASRTFTRVINTFRIMRKLVNGHVVEVSRTLIATRPVSSYVVKSAAPTQTYSEVDRYLLGMGIDESVMPLMHSTPPTGMHWMTPSELDTTRIAIDRTEAQVLLAREAEAAILARMPAFATGLSALTLDDGRRWLGAATWHIQSSVPNAPRLVADIVIPERHLTGTVTFSRPTDPAVTAAYTGMVGFVSPQPGAAVSEMRPPRLCDLGNCVMPLLADPSVSTADGPFGFIVPCAWGDALLSGLRSRDWLDLQVRTTEGWGKISLPLTGASSTLIADWEQLCCGLALPAGVRPVPDPPLPVAPVAKPPPPPPIAEVPAAPRYIEDQTRFDFKMPASGRSVDGTGPLTWVLLTEPDAVRNAPANAALATTYVNAAKFQLSLQARPSGSTSEGRLGFMLQPFAEDQGVFGPIATLTVLIILGKTGDPLLLPVSAYWTKSGNEYSVSVDVPETGEMPTEFQLEIDDVRGGSLTLSLPISEPVGQLLQAAARKHSGGGT